MAKLVTAVLLLVFLGLPAAAWQSKEEALTETQVKGTVVDVKGTTIRLKSARGTVQAYALSPVAAQRASTIKPRSEVQARIDHSQGKAVIIAFVSVTPPKPDDNGGKKDGSARHSQILVTTDLACEVSIDFKKVATLPAGGHATLDVEPGERFVTAVAANGATWKQKVKVGGEQVGVEIVLADKVPPATAAEFDQAAAAVVAALADVKGAAGHVAWVLEKKSWGFHNVQLTVSLQRAQATLKRTQDRLQALQPPDDGRRQAREELLRAGGEGGQGVALLTEAVTTAQQENSSLGKSAQTRAQALAHLSQATPDAAALAALKGSEAFRQALPTDRWVEAGLAADPQDFRLGADYDSDNPPVLGAVAKGGLAEALGLRPGDRVVSVDGKPVASGWHLKLGLRAAAGRSAQIELERDGKRDTRKVAVPATLP